MTDTTYRQFIKLGHQGEALPDDATDYVAVRVLFFDNTTGAIKSLDVARDTLPCGEVKHADAIKACAELELCGQKDWRLFTVDEALLLVDRTRHSPAINPIFNCESDWYWTSTPAAYSPSDCAWVVGFGYGFTIWNDHYYECFGRAVRSSQ